MISHISLGTSRYAEAVAFYSQVLAPLGLKLMRDTGAEAAFGTESQWCFFLYPVASPEQVTAKGTHVAFDAPSHDHVRAVHVAALQSAASDVFSPRRRPATEEPRE
jgi:catechol 2,3-dioxygenase-like lactoylglutathione lyase family enzyme